MVEDLSGLDGYQRQVKKGAHCVDISFLPALLILTLLALNDGLKRFPPTPSPSNIVHSSNKLADILGGETPSIHLGRPGGVPATIFNPALASLQRRLDNLEEVQVTRPEVDHAARYLRCAVAFYKDEALRQNAIKDLVDQMIGEQGQWGSTLSWADNIKPDGGWWYQDFLLFALELKNTLGLSGDALLQAVFDYSKIVSREKVRCPMCGFAYSSSPFFVVQALPGIQ